MCTLTATSLLYPEQDFGLSFTPPSCTVKRNMCWNIQFSAFSAIVGQCVCLYLWRREHSPRDKWYATYLVTYTFTQLVDIVLWVMHEDTTGGLQSCSAFQRQFGQAPDGSTQLAQYIISKYVIPAVVFSQFSALFLYPSDGLAGCRPAVLLLHLGACFLMSWNFACTDIVKAMFPVEHDTLRWGGYSASVLEVLPVVFFQALDFHLLIPEMSVKIAHIATFLSVVSFLWLTEGTLAAGSKWCALVQCSVAISFVC